MPDQIDPSLQGPAGSWKTGQDDDAARSVAFQEDDDGYDGNASDRSSEDSGEEAEPCQHALKCQI